MRVLLSLCIFALLGFLGQIGVNAKLDDSPFVYPRLSKPRAQRPRSFVRDAIDDSYNDGLGNYRYEVEQSDGQRQRPQGKFRNAGAKNGYIAVQGSYSWVGPDGVTYTVNYVVDDNSYQPTIEQGPLRGMPTRTTIPPKVLATLLGPGSG